MAQKSENGISSVAITDSEGMLIGNIKIIMMITILYIQKFVSHVRSIQGLEDGQDIQLPN
ncbi:15598_t:CDS:2 [Entrophospora sp. SA101]|nr:15598_t:CDS:2 [Entrophospora sp. SA101]